MDSSTQPESNGYLAVRVYIEDCRFDLEADATHVIARQYQPLGAPMDRFALTPVGYAELAGIAQDLVKVASQALAHFSDASQDAPHVGHSAVDCPRSKTSNQSD